jgi:HK97 family phage portal protein
MRKQMMAGWLDRLRVRAAANAETKASRARQADARTPLVMMTGWSARQPARGYATLVREGYMRNAVVQRAVRTVADCMASLTWVARSDGLADADHPALALLRHPSPGISGADLIEDLAAYLELAGNAYIEMVEGIDGRPAELHVLRPDRISIEPGPMGWPQAYIYSAGGAKVRFGVDAQGRCAILHLKTFHPLDDQLGLAALEAAATAIDTHNAASAWNAALLDNAARPSGALVYNPGDGAALAPEQFERLKSEMADQFQGAANAGRPMLLEGGLTWQALSLSPADMDFNTSRNGAAREIALAFGVPPLLLGLPGDNTFANYQEANKALWRLKILPLAAKLAQGLSGWLQGYWPGLELDVDRDAIPALAADREMLWSQIGAATFLSDAEKRSLLGLGQLDAAGPQPI